MSTTSVRFMFKSPSRTSESLNIDQILETRCPGLSKEFKPAWWLNNGHLQTIYCAVGDFSKIDHVRYDRTFLRTPDGGTLGIDTTPRESELEKPLADDTPIVVILHGLTGGSYETYVRSVLAVACKPKSEGGLGYRGVVVNFRGCAGVPLTSPRLYSAGATEDFHTAVLYLSQRFPKARMVGVGFSLGANVLAKYLAQEGDRCILASGCVVGCPWNIVKNCHALEGNWFTRSLYSTAMGKNVITLISRHQQYLKSAPESPISSHLPILLSGKKFYLRDVDTHAVTLIGGPSPPFPFPSPDEYYAWASTHESVSLIRIPLLAINAADDPIVQQVPSSFDSPGYVATVITRGGGHLGWFETVPGTWFTVERWVRKPIVEWLKATVEDLVVEHNNGNVIETRLGEDGLMRQVGREDIGYKVVQMEGGVVDTADAGATAGLTAGL